MSSRSSPMVSLSKSIQEVTNREAVGVLQGQRSANSQYDDNSKLAFSFPEETDSPWQLRPKMFAYFCSNKFFSAFKREYIVKYAVRALCVHNTTNCLPFHIYCISNSNQYGFPMHTRSENHTLPIVHKCAFLHISLSPSFCPSNVFRGVAVQPTSGSS